MQKAIWDLKNQSDETVSSFEGLDRMGKQHFQSLFKAVEEVLPDEVIRMTQIFPGFLTPGDNINLLEVVSKDKLKEVLRSFQKGKIPGLDRWTIEFFIALYEIIG